MQITEFYSPCRRFAWHPSLRCA